MKVISAKIKTFESGALALLMFLNLVVQTASTLLLESEQFSASADLCSTSNQATTSEHFEQPDDTTHCFLCLTNKRTDTHKLPATTHKIFPVPPDLDFLWSTDSFITLSVLSNYAFDTRAPPLTS